MDSRTTAQIVRAWYDSIGRGDAEAVMNGLSEAVEFELPLDEYNKIIPYLGIHIGRAQITKAFEIRAQTTQVQDYELRDLVAQGNTAFAVVYTKAIHTRTKKSFEIEDAHRLVLDDDGKIRYWKVYFDPNGEIAAFKDDIDMRLLEAVRGGHLDQVQELLDFGANANTRDADSGLTVLGMAAGQANPAMVRILLGAGADPLAVDRGAGASILHKACQGGSAEVARQLVEAGAFVDAVAPTTGHTPLMDALWFKWPDIVAYLLDQGAGLNLATHYGFSLKEHFEFELNVNIIGKDRLLQADELLKRRQRSDEEQAERQELMAAVSAGDVDAVRKLIRSGANVDERYPRMNQFNDAHTPLLVAARDGHTRIVAMLLQSGADVNAVEPVFGAVPLHKAVYNGHAEITRMLARQPGVRLNVQGATNGYTPLHDALWHGYADCGEALIDAGARLDLRGHDGKTPLDLAKEAFGPDHPVVKRIESQSGKRDQ